MQENKEVSRIETLYQEDFVFTNIEKRFNKLIKLKVDPYINCIVFQYYLIELGGDHYTKGLLPQIEKYIEKINKNIDILDNFKNSEKTKELLLKKKENALKIEKKIKKNYEEYIKKCNNDEYSVKFDIYNFHLKQLLTFQIVNKKIENKNHIEDLKKDKKRIEKLLDTEKDEIFQKLLESHLGVIDQQFELLR
jgi:hypothetical protein